MVIEIEKLKIMKIEKYALSLQDSLPLRRQKIFSAGQKGDFPFATILWENAGTDFNSRGSSAP